MATRRTTSNGDAPKFGVPVGKFLELSQKTNKVGPYDITDELSVPPPTKKRNEQIRDARQRAVVAQAQLNIAYSLSGMPGPPLPAPAAEVKPAKLPDDADEDAKTAAVDAATAANVAAAAEYKLEVAEWKQDIRQWRANLNEVQKQIAEFSDAGVKADEDYERAVLGPDYDRIVEFFDELDESLWSQFRDDLNKHWVPSQPADDLDPDDEVEVGKAPKSSTG